MADTSKYEEKIKILENDLLHYKGLVENERRSRQSVTDNMSKKDLHLEDLERINFELTNQVDLKNEIIRQREDEISHLKYQIRDCDKENQSLQKDISEQNERVKELETDLAQCGECYKGLEKEMSVLKAKELDRMGNGQKLKELETKARNLQYEKEILQKDLERAKGLEDELQYFKNNQDQHFQVFEEKFEDISVELKNLKEENLALKDSENSLREKVKTLIKEKDELLRELHDSENMDLQNRDKRLHDIENMLKGLTDKSVSASKEDLFKKSVAEQENKNRKNELVSDLQERIKKFKDDYSRKKNSKEYFINE